MALIVCPECGKEISDRAPACIFCGYPLEKDTSLQRNEEPKDTIVSDLVNRAEQLRISKKYANALQLYEKAAKLGDAYSQVWIGNYYDRGIGVEKDYKKAVYWFTMAAKQNNSIAYNNLGTMYEAGNGVAKNGAKAAECFLRASNAGYDIASANLARLYHYGNGVPQNYELAVKYYNLAITQGSEDAVAFNNLAVLYMDGKGTEKDYIKAEQLLTVAIEKGNEKAKANLNILRARETKKKSSNKLVWYLCAVAVVMVLGSWFLISELGEGAIGVVFSFILAVAVVSFVIYIYFVSDDRPTSEEIAENFAKEKYNNYRFTCPNCGSQKVKSIGTLNRGFSVYLWGLASSKIGKQYECDNCKHKW